MAETFDSKRTGWPPHPKMPCPGAHHAWRASRRTKSPARATSLRSRSPRRSRNSPRSKSNLRRLRGVFLGEAWVAVGASGRLWRLWRRRGRRRGTCRLHCGPWGKGRMDGQRRRNRPGSGWHRRGDERGRRLLLHGGLGSRRFLFGGGRLPGSRRPGGCQLLDLGLLLAGGLRSANCFLSGCLTLGRRFLPGNDFFRPGGGLLSGSCLFLLYRALFRHGSSPNGQYIDTHIIVQPNVSGTLAVQGVNNKKKTAPGRISWLAGGQIALARIRHFLGGRRAALQISLSRQVSATSFGQEVTNAAEEEKFT